MFSKSGQSLCHEVKKSQVLRIIDISVYGPFLIYVAKTYKLPKSVKMGLYALGISTILYNGKNYILTQEGAK